MAGKVSKPSKQGTTAFARLRAQLQAVDLLFEVRDARLPRSSRHPKADELFGNKPRIIVLAKQDLADAEQLRGWLERLSEGEQRQALALSFKVQKGQDKLVNLSLKLTEERRAAHERKGLLPRPMRVCVVGLPNVGKSTLINWLIGKRKAKTGDRPGITLGTQWVRVHPQLELLDTPGLLPPVAFSRDVSMKLSLCNILPGAHYDVEEVAEYGLEVVAAAKPEALELYGENFVSEGAPPNLAKLAQARNCLAAGGRLDTQRAGSIFLNDLRSGRLGRLVLDTLEKPSQQ